MKKFLQGAVALLLLSTFNSQFLICHAQGTAFTYQGRLNNGTNSVSGSFDLRFALFNAAVSGVQQGPTLTNAAAVISNGLFTVTLDFGNQFPGTNRWLEMSVRSNTVPAFTTLAPRQQLTPVPYAITAENLASGLSIQNNTNGGPSVIEGYSGNYVANGVIGATIGGGGVASFSGLRFTNSVVADFGTVGGGYNNTAGGGGGTISGGFLNATFGPLSTIGGGGFNIASGNYATVVGGGNNDAVGLYSTVCGGNGNYAAGYCSFAAGSSAIANHNGSFVWADNSVTDLFYDAATNQFLIRAGGGVGIGTASTPPGGLCVASGGLAVTGASSPNYGTNRGVFIEKSASGGLIYAFNYSNFTPTNLLLNSPGGNVGIGTSTPNALLQVGNATCNGTTWANASDRDSKKNFDVIDSRAVLEKVSALPISKWQYKAEADGVKHIGPMAQDFHAAFGLNGGDEKHISTVDEGGVALAAIQGLNEKLEVRSQKLEVENAELKARLEKIEKMMNSKLGKQNENFPDPN